MGVGTPVPARPRLPGWEWTPKAAEVHECPICLESLGNDTLLHSLPCFHTFHEACIRRWFERKQECPMCMSTPQDW